MQTSDYMPEPQRQSPSVWTVLAGLVFMLVLVSVSAGGGFMWGRSYERANPPAVEMSSANEDLVAGTITDTTEREDLEGQFEVFWEAWDLIATRFYHTDPLDQQKMVYGSIRGMLQSLDDDFTTFKEPEAAERSREDLRGEFEGIGAYVEFQDGLVLIVSPIEDTPASRANLRPGDVIVAVDAKLLSEVTDGLGRDEALNEAIKLIRGPKGSQVTLTIFRPESNEEFDVDIIRDAIPLISVRAEMIDDIAYINVSEFKQTTFDEFDKVVSKLFAENQPKAVILDLRNNPGGYVNQAQNITGRFIDEGLTYIQEDSDGTTKEYSVLQNGTTFGIYDLPVIVLVNGGSASASEIVGGALQDYDRAELLGEKTFGKGSVQSVNQLSDGSELRVTIAHWLTPEKRAIHGEGIDPDFMVPFSNDASEYPVACILNQQPAEDAETCGDSQLFWALQRLNDGTEPPLVTPTPQGN